MPKQLVAPSDKTVIKTESFNDSFFDCGWKILNERDIAAGKPMRVGGRFQHADMVNGNGRVYPVGLWEKTFEDPDVVSRLQHRRMLGELEHPADGQTNLNRVAHLITKMELREDGEVYGEVEVMNTPAGQIAQELFKHGVTVGVSSRGRGSSYSRTGTHGEQEEVVDDDYVLETFDLVYNPSTPDAFLTRLESITESLSPEARELLRGIAKGVLHEESKDNSNKPRSKRATKSMKKELKEALGNIIKRASDVGKLVSEAEGAELPRYEDEILNMMVEAEDAVIQEPALKPIVEHAKIKLAEVKQAIENRFDGTERKLTEEVERHLNGSDELTEDRTPDNGDTKMVTIPAKLFQSLAESNQRHSGRVRQLTEARANIGKKFVTKARYEAAVRLCNTVIRKGRGFRSKMEQARKSDFATTSLLERFIEVTDGRQVKLETNRVCKMFPKLVRFKESLMDCVSARHVRQTANHLLKGLSESQGRHPVNKKPTRRGPVALHEGRRPSKPRVRAKPGDEIAESQDRGLAIASKAVEKLGWKS